MSHQQQYENWLDENNRVRATFIKRRKEIIGFLVQYEAKIKNKWRPIIRYDTAHGQAPHKDTEHPNGIKTKEPLFLPSKSIALTYAINDLKAHWPRYRKRYEEEMKNEEK